MFLRSNRVRYKKNLILFTLVIMNVVDQPAPEVTIEQGVLSGKISADGSYFEYIGIPYATVNSSYRFKAPGPAPSWEGVYKATDEIYLCAQNVVLELGHGAGIAVVGNEDCLRINVYVPSMPKTKPLAVMAFVHGGAFVFGSGSKLISSPGFLIKKDVIVVTFNYRLGPLGFLCLRIKEAPGNAGLKDQIAALKWIKKNIAAFGGDPENVTIFGVSAGAASVSLLLASEASNGLFKRAIAQSGTAVSHWAINRRPIWIASLIVKTLGYNTEDPMEIYEILSKMNYKDITAIYAQKPLDLFNDVQLLHLPCVEYDIPGTDPFLIDLPHNIFRNKTKDVEVIFGIMSKEGLFFVSETTDDILRERNGRYLFASDIKFSSQEEAMSLARKVQQFYFGDYEISMKQKMNLSDFYSDLYFEVPAIFETEYFLKNPNSKVYNYVFDYSGNRNFLKARALFWNEPGASHGDDIFYIFDSVLVAPFWINKNDRKIIENMTTMWTNFAKYGDPTPDTSEIPIKWLPSTKENLNFLYINSELKMGPMLNPIGFQFWKEIYDKHLKTDID